VFDGMVWLWVGFNAFVLAMLAIDLGVFHRSAHAVTVKEATIWSIAWISLAMLFCLGIYFFWDIIAPSNTYTRQDAALAFLTGYLIEKSLSVDNIFVFVLIFSYFAVPPIYQHRVLYWGILGALLMRGILIALGAALIHEFHWIIYVFGAFLIFTGIRMAFHKDEELHPEQNPLVNLVRRVLPVTRGYVGDKFFVRNGGVVAATPLFLVLVIVESTDLVFAVDSIPAIFAVTTDPFLVYTSNVFAILGLRSLYFLLAGVIDKFHYLKLGLAVVLTYVGVKMVIVDIYKIPTLVSLGIVATVLTISVVASLIWAKESEEERPAELSEAGD
jgi:tellurite resistance protein TerC